MITGLELGGPDWRTGGFRFDPWPGQIFDSWVSLR